MLPNDRKENENPQGASWKILPSEKSQRGDLKIRLSRVNHKSPLKSSLVKNQLQGNNDQSPSSENTDVILVQDCNNSSKPKQRCVRKLSVTNGDKNETKVNSSDDFETPKKSKSAFRLKKETSSDLSVNGPVLRERKVVQFYSVWDDSSDEDVEKALRPANRRRKQDPDFALSKGKDTPVKPSARVRSTSLSSAPCAKPSSSPIKTKRSLSAVKNYSRSTVTPKKWSKASKRLIMTPGIQERSVPLVESVNPLQEALLRLHVSAVPENLPCRENEFAEIFTFVESNVRDKTSACMYISGVPGTGKTATVREAMRHLKAMARNKELDQFDFIEINGMRLTDPRQAYVHIWKSITNEKTTADHAKNLLNERFADEKEASKTKNMIVILVDELDMLLNKKQDVLYNIFEWPTIKFSKLIVLAIANTMDLPEKVLINRVSSRLGLTRLTFAPYNHLQLKEIVVSRLTGLTVFDGDAIQLVARKVASLSGDARRALDICRRASELAQRDESSKSQLVQLQHVMKAHEEMFSTPKILLIRHCNFFEKLVLKSLVSIFQKTGIEETELRRVFRMINELSLLDGKSNLSESELHFVIGRLSSSRLILVETDKWGRLDMKLRLNISQDDINFALKEI